MGDTVPATPDNGNAQSRRGDVPASIAAVDEALEAAERALRAAMNDLYAIDAEVVGRWLLGSIDAGRLALRRQVRR